MDMRSPAPKILTLSETAAEQIKRLMAEQAPNAIGLRVSVQSKGCSGLGYAMEFATTKRADDVAVEDQGVTLFVTQSAEMYIIGSELDYRKTEFEESFVFENPNKTGGCGCGESFTTDSQAAQGASSGGCCGS